MTTEAEVVVLKGPWHDGRYRRMFAGIKVERILEFGIFEGGSAFLLADILPDAKVVGVDMRKENPAIQKHIRDAGLEDRVRLHFGVLQDDKDAIRRIIRQEFGTDKLDMVIDDCSHQYGLTKASFDIAFPYLKSGGHYVIEDWDWAHYPTNSMRAQASPVLSNLVFELLSGITSNYDQLAEARVVRGMAVFERGPAPLAASADALAYADRDWPKL